MALFIAGLVIFLGVHSTRIFAEGWRAERIRRMGEKPWKGVYSLVSIASFVAMVWGYRYARHDPTVLWTSPGWTRDVTALLTLPAFIFLVAAYVPGTRMKAALGHPMLAGTALWALGHLLSNGQIADVLLFGGFLVWSVADFATSRARDRRTGVTYPVLGVSRDVIAAVVGIVAFVVFGMYLHRVLIGVQPFGA